MVTSTNTARMVHSDQKFQIPHSRNYTSVCTYMYVRIICSVLDGYCTYYVDLVFTLFDASEYGSKWVTVLLGLRCVVVMGTPVQLEIKVGYTHMPQ